MISSHCGCVQSMNKAIEAQRANTNMQHVKKFSFDLGQAQEYCRNVKLGLKFMLSLIKIGKHFLDKIVDGFFLKDLLKTSLIKKFVWIIVKIWHASCEILKFHFPPQTELFYRQKNKYSNSLNVFEMLLGFFLSSMSLSPTGGKIQIFTTSYQIFTLIHSRFFYILRLYAR